MSESHEPSAPSEGAGRYELRELLGEGGMGRVYRAWDAFLEREVALKFIRNDDLLEAQRLLLEARIQAGLDHPAVAKVFEVGDWDGRPFIAMQRVRGEALDVAARELSWKAKAELMARVAEAVHAAHLKGLVHRDLKPANILVETGPSGERRPFVLDFGLARGASQPGSSLAQLPAGTLAYMAPEQASGMASVDARSDIYSLGATLYALLAGAPPFSDRRSAPESRAPEEVSDSARLPEAQFALFRAVLEAEPEPLRRRVKGLPRDLETITATCLQKDPRRRYASAQVLAEDLRRFIDGHPITARPPGLLTKGTKLVLRHRALTGLAAVALLILAAQQVSAVRRTWRAGADSVRLGAEAQDLEAQLRMAYLRPRHDLRPDLVAARTRLARLEATVREGGRNLEGPGDFALGRAYLALRDYEPARQALERARERGLRGPDLALALGTTYGELYRARRAEVERIADPSLRQKALAEANREGRDRALEHLREAARERGDGALYAEGLLAFYQDALEEALAKARAAIARNPALYEARKLEGDVLLDMGRKRVFAGDMKGGLPPFELSREAYAKALDMARSDPTLHRAEGKRCYILAYAQLARGLDPSETLAQGLAAVAAASEVNPEDSTTAHLGANLSLEQADFESKRGRSPAEALRQAQAFAERGIALAANRSDSWEILAAVCGARVDGMAWGDGAIPPLVDRGLTATSWALQINPASNNAHYIRAMLLLNRALLQESAGQDPRADLREGIEHAQKAQTLGGNRPLALMAEGQLSSSLALYEVERGLEAEPSAALATERFAQAQATGAGLAVVAGPHAAWLDAWAHIQLDLGHPAGPQRQALQAMEQQMRKEGGPPALIRLMADARHLLDLREQLEGEVTPERARKAALAAQALADRLGRGLGTEPDPERARLALRARSLEVLGRFRAGEPWLAAAQRGQELLRHLAPREQDAGLPLLRSVVRASGAAAAAPVALVEDLLARSQSIHRDLPELAFVRDWLRGASDGSRMPAVLARNRYRSGTRG
ncbi:MAG TPA: serine/threonine-protein kinase [Holophagaceae bacterium]|nr:serine/threonine-protein kinase [Holophagaceae bacterium]